MSSTGQRSPEQWFTSDPGEERGKLRSACDAYSVAKVKYNRKVPCERCQLSALTCLYSPSRRHGKQYWARRVGKQHQQYLQATMYDYGPQVPATMMGSFPQDHPQYGSPGLAAPTRISPVMRANQRIDSVMTNGPLETPSVYGFDVGQDAKFANPWTASSSVGAPWSTSTASMSPRLGPPPPRPVHDCEMNALATMQSLHHNAIGQSNQTPADPPTSASSSPPRLPPLDRILYLNRVAISTVRILIDCPCAQQPHLALLCMAIISKTLFWYRLAISLSFETATPSSPSQSQSQHQHQHQHQHQPPLSHLHVHAQSTPVSPVSHTATSITPTPPTKTIRIGTFDITPQDEAIIIRNVLLREVTKVQHLVDTMKNINMRTHKGDDPERVIQGAGEWYAVGGARLEGEARDTVEEVLRGFGGGEGIGRR